MKKCRDFKRMIVEAIPAGENIGVPIPIGYSDVYDLEHWPLLQAFAMDEIVPGASSGFITSRNSFVDVTEKMDTLFQSVDSYVVSRAVNTMVRTIQPHTHQFLEQLGVNLCDSLSGSWDTNPASINAATARNAAATAEELLGPLDLLFEFGNMHTLVPARPEQQPVILFGSDTKAIGNTSVLSDLKWRDECPTTGSLHCVVEGCEPTTGLRWCRTYMLHRGRNTHRIVIDSLVQTADTSAEVMDEHGETQVDLGENDPVRYVAGSSNVSAVVEQGLRRIEALYFKLYLTLRYAVRCAFSMSADILEAANKIQVSIRVVGFVCFDETISNQ